MLTLLTFLLHFLFLGGHIILLGIWSQHLERNILVSLNESSHFSVTATVIAQVIGTIYLALLIFLTQLLALRKQLSRRQNPSAMHDQLTAWSGIGQALATNLRQIRPATNLSGLVVISLYLLSVFALHITVPALFSIQPVNIAVAPSFPTTWPNDILQTISTSNAGRSRAAGALMQFYVLNPPWSSAGIYDNRLYETQSMNASQAILIDGIPFRMESDAISNGDITVNSTLFRVSCRRIDGMRQTSFNATSSTWVVETPIHNLTVSDMQPGLLRISSHSGGIDLPDDILIYGNVGITDSNNDNGSIVTLDPAVNSGEPGASWNELTVAACTLNATFQPVQISPQSGLISPSSIPSNSFPTENIPWGTWESLTHDPKVDGAWARVMDTRISSARPAALCVSEGITPGMESTIIQTPCKRLDMLRVEENFINERLEESTNSTFTTNLPGTVSILESVHLRDLEVVLEDATTTLYFGEISTNRFLSTPSTSFIISKAELNLNLAPLIVGALASLILVICFILLVVRPRTLPASLPNKKTEDAVLGMDSVGLLQVLWVFGNNGVVVKPLLEVKDPSSLNLRKAATSLTCDSDVELHGLASSSHELF